MVIPGYKGVHAVTVHEATQGVNEATLKATLGYTLGCTGLHKNYLVHGAMNYFVLIVLLE